jgi:hypothetical protein
MGFNNAYGYPQPSVQVPKFPIIAERAPLDSDTHFQVGQIWIWPANGEWILNQVLNFAPPTPAQATWNPIGGATDVISTINHLPPTNGNIDIVGTAQQIAVANAGSTVTLSIPAVAANATSFESGSFITNTAATSTSLSSNSWTAIGTNANINLNLLPKALGVVNQAFSSIGNSVAYVAQNTDATNGASNASFFSITAAGGGDPTGTYAIAAGNSFTLGLDNDINDQFSIASGVVLGTNDNLTIQTAGSVNFPRSPAFLGYLGGSTVGVTGNGAVYTLGTDALTKLYDISGNFTTAGVFTAPVTGLYDLRAQVSLGAFGSSSSIIISIVTPAKTYTKTFTQSSNTAQQSIDISVLAQIAAAGTAHVTISADGAGGNNNTILGSATVLTFFTGRLAA